jgi:hypothetical protein
MLATLNLFAGISFNPGVRGILVVAVGVTVLMGSVYLLLGTNVGARLGLLVTLAGLFGFLSILAMLWWLLPPANGPRGNNPRWEVVEVYVNDGEPARTQVIESLIPPDQLPSSADILAANPELEKEYPNGFVLSDLAANNPDIIQDVLPKDSLNGWRLTPSSSAGEAQTAADTALVAQKFFTATTDYKKLNTFEYGGKPRRADACGDRELLCRAKFRIERALTFWDNPVHYAVVQVQPVIPQATKPGEAPPLPIVDPSRPVYSIVLVRDLGDVRLIPFLYFVISFSLFIIFAWVLHNREKTLMKNKAMAEAALGGD